MKRRIWLLTLFLACLATVSAAGVHAATWTFTPELKRLNADGTELPEGMAKVVREGLRVGLYLNVSTDGVNPADDSALGFDQLAGAIHFSSDELGMEAIGPVLQQLEGGEGWMRSTRNFEFDSPQDNALGPPNIGSGTDDSWIFTWDDFAGTADRRGAWCVPTGNSRSCEIFLGVLTVPLANLPGGASGMLTLSVGGVDSAQEAISVRAMHGRADETPQPGNSVTYTICSASGCPVSASFAAASYAAGEGESVEVTVTLDAAPGREVTIPIQATGVGADLYNLSAESVTFGPEDTSRSFMVTAVENDADANPETVGLNLAFGELPAPVNAGAPANATVAITDNDDPSVTVAFGREEYAAMEGGDPVMVTVVLSAAPERVVTIPIMVRVEGGATSDDFSVAPESVTFGPNETEKRISVTAVDDNARDRDERLTLGFGDLPEGVVAGGPGGDPATATVMLVDDDSGRALMVMLGTPSATSVEEGGAVEIPVKVHPAPEQADLTVTYGLTPDTAAAGDYNDETGGSITIAAGESEGMIRVTVADDNLSEAAETFRVMLTGVTSSDDENEPAELGPEASRGADLIILANDPLTASLSGPERVREGQTAAYTLSLDGGVGTEDVTATLAVGTGSTADGDDYMGVLPTVTVPAGESQASFQVAIVDDGSGEGEQLLVLEIVRVEGGGGDISVNPAARRVSTTIIELDADGRARAMKFALAGFGRTLGDDVVELMDERAQARDPASGGSYVKLAGRPVLPTTGDSGADTGVMSWVGGAAKWMGVNYDDPAGLARDAQSLASRGVEVFRIPTTRELVSQSAFQFTLSANEKNAPGDGRAGAWTLWGRGDAAGFDGRFDSDFSMDGDVVAAHVGVDYRPRRSLLMGVALSRREGKVDYDFVDASGGHGDIKMNLTSVHPYLNWSPRPGLSLWGTVGAGRGGADLTDDGGGADTDLKMFIAAAGTRGQLMRLMGLDLALKADAFQVRIDSDDREDLPEVSAKSSRLRLAVEGLATRELGGGSRLTGGVEFGVRVDGGDAETGAGTELGAKVGYAHPGGLNVEARGRFLLSNGKNDFDQWGASMQVTLDPGASGQGLQFSLTPTYGKASSGVEALWNRDKGSDALPGSDSGHTLGLVARVGYGFELPGTRGVLTPFGEMSLQGGDWRRLRLGAEIGRWRLGRSALALELYGEQDRAGRDRETDRRVVMNARWNF